MSQASCLDPVIYRVDAATQAERPGEKRVVVNINNRSAVSAGWFRPASSLKYFLVSTRGGARCQTSVIYVSDSANERAIGLRVQFEVRCAEGREERVAEALCDDPNPGAVLMDKVREWVREYISQQPTAFINRFFEAKVELESHLSARALAETSLDMNAEIFLCGEEEVVRYVQLGPLMFSVKLRDYDEPLNVSLRAELITDQENMINAVAYRADSTRLDELVQEHTRQYFAEKVNLHQFYGEPESVEAGLKEYLDEVLKVLGRRVQTLHIEYDRDVPLEPYEVEEEVEYRAAGHAEPIIIRNAMRMSVRDYAAYLNSNSPEPGAWLKENFKQVVQQTLSDKAYVDILLELDLAARDIRNKVSFRAAGIGCAIEQHLVITNHLVETWLNGFNIRAEEAFETGLEGFCVRLKVEAVAMLTQLQVIKQYVSRGLDISKLMEKRMLDEVRQTTLTIHPERLYGRTVLAEPDGEESWKALLGRRIREVLVRDFDAEVISVSVELIDAEFIKWLRDLRRETISFEAEVSSHSPHNTGPFIFYGDCQVEDIFHEGWEKVWSMGFDINQLKGRLINALKSGMETRADADLAYLNSETAEKIKGEIERFVTNHARHELGLIVKVCNVRRKPTELEKKMREAKLANELLRIEMLHKLEQRMIQLIANGGREEEISQVQKSISTLQAYSPNNVAQMSNLDRQTLPTEPNGRARASALENSDVHDNQESRTGHVTGN
jgi:hypothetical protein